MKTSEWVEVEIDDEEKVRIREMLAGKPGGGPAQFYRLLQNPKSFDLEALKKKFEKNPDPTARYEVEYDNRCYRAYKPGIDPGAGDDRLAIFVECALEDIFVVVELGGGPAYIAQGIVERQMRSWGRDNGLGICADIAAGKAALTSLALQEAGTSVWPHVQVEYLQGDVTDKKFIRRLLLRTGKHHRGHALIVSSYCLDRVSDQRAAIANFAYLVREIDDAIGLITVCLPAQPASPGVRGLEYSTDGGWITEGQEAMADYQLIKQECEQNGLVWLRGGLTTHFGFSLDGWEELPCYVMVLKKAEGEGNEDSIK
ncbi:MAG: hypothetical protein ABII72_00375 [Parcubacteria group bacterium]